MPITLPLRLRRLRLFVAPFACASYYHARDAADDDVVIYYARFAAMPIHYMPPCFRVLRHALHFSLSSA